MLVDVPAPLPDPLVELIAHRFRVLGEPARIKLLDALRSGPATVGELAGRLGLSQQNTSKHLGVLADLLQDMRRDTLADAARVEANFRERLRTDELAGEWRLVEGFAPEQVALHARYADLAVLGQADPDGGGGTPASAGALVEQAIREAKDARFAAGQTDATLADALAEVANRSLSGLAVPTRTVSHPRPGWAPPGSISTWVGSTSCRTHHRHPPPDGYPDERAPLRP